MAGTELGKAYVQIIPSAEGISKNMQKVLGKEMPSVGEDAGKGFASSFASKVKSVIAKAAIGTAIAKTIQSALTEGAALEQSLGGVETIFKESADIVKEYAKNAYKNAGVSANEYMEQITSFSASLLQSLGGDTKKAADYADRALVDMSDNANKMGSNIEDIQYAYQGFAKQNYTMLDNLKLGYGGTKEEMQRLVKDASKMKDVQKELNVSVKSGSLEFGNIINAISVVQKSLGITGTTAYEAATTFLGSFGMMKASVKDFLGNLALGENIKPALNNMLSSTNTFFVKNFLPMLWRVVKELPGVGGEIISQLVNGVKSAFPEFEKAFPPLFDQIKNKAFDMLKNLTEGFKNNFPGMLSAFLDLLQEIGDFLAEQAPWFIEKGFDLLSDLVKGIIDAIPVMIQKLPTVITTFANIINDNMPVILQKGAQLIWELIKGIIGSIPLLIESLPQVIEAIFAVWNAINWIDLGKNLIDGIKNGIKNMFESLKTTASELFNSLKTKIDEIFGNILSSAGNIWNAVKNAIVHFTTEAFSGVKNIFTNMLNGITGIFKGILSSASSIWNGIKNSIHSIASGIKLSVQGIFNGIKSSISSIFTGIKNTATSIWNGIKSAITSPMESAKNLIKGIINSIKGFFNFKISWPKIPLPHFSIKPKGWGIGDLLKGKIPSLGISWYAKGGILDAPTIFGMSGNSLLGGGEAGTEVVSPLSELERYYKKWAGDLGNQSDSELVKMLKTLLEILKNIDEKTDKEYYFNINGRQFALATADDMNVVLNQLMKKGNRR